jgi:RND family efflux transporter MFP subunit
MSRKAIVLGVAVVLALAAVGVATRDYWSPGGNVGQASKGKADGKQKNAQRPVGVLVAKAQLAKVPEQVESLGTVTPIASVAIKSRLETEIVSVHFSDGAIVQKGDVLFTLDSRAIESQMKEIEGTLASARAQFESAERDVKRYKELAARNATTQVTLNNAETQVTIWRAVTNSNNAKLENLKVLLSYCTIRAPISGRISMAAVKIGNLVRPADAAPLATINQMAPVYVTFPLPQRYLPELRDAIAAKTSTVEALIPGDKRRADGQVTMIENTVDTSTGTVLVRATMANKDEVLWPGTLVTVDLTLRVEEAVTVPPTAVQVGQSGSYVFVVRNGTATVQPVEVGRVNADVAVITRGLKGGEVVVTDGQLRLTSGSKVVPRNMRGES